MVTAGGMATMLNEFCKQVAKAIVDEMEAISFYEEMYENTESDSEKDIINNIINQEIDHMKQFRSLLEDCPLTT